MVFRLLLPFRLSSQKQAHRLFLQGAYYNPKLDFVNYVTSGCSNYDGSNGGSQVTVNNAMKSGLGA